MYEIDTVLRDHSISPKVQQSQVIWKCSLGGKHRNWGFDACISSRLGDTSEL